MDKIEFINTRVLLFVLALICSLFNCSFANEPIKILAIGNSFSADAVEYLDDLAEADNVNIIVGNLVIGGFWFR